MPKNNSLSDSKLLPQLGISWKKSRARLDTTCSPVEVDADILSVLCVHKHLKLDKYCVTQRITGLIVTVLESHEEARKVCEYLVLRFLGLLSKSTAADITAAVPKGFGDWMRAIREKGSFLPGEPFLGKLPGVLEPVKTELPFDILDFSKDEEE